MRCAIPIRWIYMDIALLLLLLSHLHMRHKFMGIPWYTVQYRPPFQFLDMSNVYVVDLPSSSRQ